MASRISCAMLRLLTSAGRATAGACRGDRKVHTMRQASEDFSGVCTGATAALDVDNARARCEMPLVTS